MDTPSGKTQAIKQYGKQDWQENVRWLKIVLRLVQRVARAIEATLYEMFPDPDVPTGTTIPGDKNEASKHADIGKDPVVQRND